MWNQLVHAMTFADPPTPEIPWAHESESRVTPRPGRPSPPHDPGAMDRRRVLHRRRGPRSLVRAAPAGRFLPSGMVSGPARAVLGGHRIPDAATAAPDSYVDVRAGLFLRPHPHVGGDARRSRESRR